MAQSEASQSEMAQSRGQSSRKGATSLPLDQRDSAPRYQPLLHLQTDRHILSWASMEILGTRGMFRGLREGVMVEDRV